MLPLVGSLAAKGADVLVEAVAPTLQVSLVLRWSAVMLVAMVVAVAVVVTMVAVMVVAGMTMVWGIKAGLVLVHGVGAVAEAGRV